MTLLVNEMDKAQAEAVLKTATKGYLEDNLENLGVYDQKYTMVITQALVFYEAPFEPLYEGNYYRFELSGDGVGLNIYKNT